MTTEPTTANPIVDHGEQMAAVPDEAVDVAAKLLDKVVSGHLDAAHEYVENDGGAVEDYSPHPVSIEGDARAIVAAVTPLIADETVLQVGRDLLDDGIEAVLHRLVGEKHAAFILQNIQAEAVEDAARAKFGLPLTAHGSIRQDLYDYAKALRAAPLPGSPLADSEGGVR